MRDIYQFVYLYIYNITTDNGDKESDGSALFAFTALLTSNVLFPFMVLSDEKLNLKWPIIIFYGGLSTVNYFMFVLYDKSLVRIKQRWEAKNPERKALWKRNIYRYIIASIILFISPIALKIFKQFS
jgi:hypothetical protein